MPQKCPQCSASLPMGVLAGLCPACLMQQGAAADTATCPEAKPFVPLTVEEVARLFPQLEILGFLGKGGMGAVYKARQPALDRLVALKILPAQTAPDPGFAERFTREARALARLSHPNIVAVYEFGQVTTSGAGVPPARPPGVRPVTVPPAGETPAPLPPAALPYFIMEFVDGVNLRQLQRAGRLSPREALQIVPQICDALQYAHDEGVVHRDIKPENVLVDRKGRVKIADFGLAKIIKGGDASPGRSDDGPGKGEERTAGPAVPTYATEAGQVMGTPHYMAPEQIEHPQDVDHRADIYSLGVVFYEMLTGELPLGKFQPPSRKVQVDVRLDEVVLHALEKEPELRYQHASEVKTDVQTITSSAPAKATSPATTPPVLSSPGRRGKRRFTVALIAGGVLALLFVPFVLLLLPHFLAKTGIDAPPGLVGWWRGEGNAVDEVGGNDGVLMNGVGFDAGVVGRAFRFKGISYVSVPDAPALRLTEELTIEFWVKRQDLQVVDYIINKGGDYTHGALNYGVVIDPPQWGSKLAFTFAGGFRRSSPIADLNWHHVAVVARNGDADPTFYVDGVEQPVTDRGGSPSINLHASKEPLQIGAQVDPDKAWVYHSRAVVDEVSIYNRSLAAAEIQAIFAAGSHGKRKPARGLAAIISAAMRRLEPGPSRPLAATRPPGIVGWWHGEGNANDSAGTNNGTLIGEATYALGKVGQAFSFHPDSGTVLVPDSPSLRLTKEFTIEAWIKPRSVSDPGGYAVVGKVGIGTGLNGYQLVVVGDTLHGLFNSPGTSWPSQRIISEPLFSTGVWYHVAFTYDQSAMKLYCNGQLVATSEIGPHPIANTSSDFRISGADDHCYFDGMIDEVAVYNRPLSAAEIEANYATAQNGKREPARK